MKKNRLLNFRREKVLLCIAVPTSEQQFEEISEKNTDFFHQIITNNNSENAWDKYKTDAYAINECIDDINKYNAKAIKCFSSSDFDKIKGYDIIIFIAHITSKGNVELWDGEISSKDFVRKIKEVLPTYYRGIIDCCACFSSEMVEDLRSYFNYRECVVARNGSISIALHTILIPKIISKLNRGRISYLEAIENTYSEYFLKLKILEKSENSFNSVRLGTEANTSSLYAPTKARVDDVFLIQVLLYNNSDSDKIRHRAMTIDENAVEKETIPLDFDLMKGDNIHLRLQILNNRNNSFSILDDEFEKNNTISDLTKHLKYNAMIHRSIFYIRVNADCSQEKCCCRLLMYSNGQSIGEFGFDVKIIGQDNTVVDTSRNFSFKNQKTYQEEAGEKLQKELLLLKEKLSKDITHLDNETDIQSRSNHLKIIDECIKIIYESHLDKIDNTVFISSTSDLTEERQAAQKGVLRSGITPCLYENWGQDGRSPLERCCYYAMKSRYFVCILGPRYGYVDPDINLSMTKIEYLIAMYTGKPTAFFLRESSGYSESVQDQNAFSEQQSFLNEIKRDKHYEIINNIETLQYMITNAIQGFIINDEKFS